MRYSRIMVCNEEDGMRYDGACVGDRLIAWGNWITVAVLNAEGDVLFGPWWVEECVRLREIDEDEESPPTLAEQSHNS